MHNTTIYFAEMDSTVLFCVCLSSKIEQNKNKNKICKKEMDSTGKNKYESIEKSLVHPLIRFLQLSPCLSCWGNVR